MGFFAFSRRRAFLCPERGGRAIGALLLAAALGATLALVPAAPARAGDDEGATVRTLESAPDSFRFLVSGPRVRLKPAEGGETEVAIRGFDVPLDRPGAPALPLRSWLVAVPFGADVRVEARALRTRRIEGVVPRPVPGVQRPSGDRGDRDFEPVAVFDRDPALYRGSRPFPEAWVRLGSTGILRDQRYAEIVVQPVRWDPVARALTVADEIDVVVRFEGGEAAGVPASADPVFEPVYRSRLLNYGQARAFRKAPREEAAARSAEDRSARGSGPRARLTVREDGPVRVPHAVLAPLGWDAAPISTWTLTGRGVALPFEVDGDGDDAFEPGEALLFYGQKKDDEPRSVLSYDIPTSSTDIYAAGDYWDETVYFLDANGAGSPPLETIDGAPLGATPPSSFPETRKLEVDDAYRPIGGGDPWYWLPTISLTFNSPSRIEALDLPGLVAAAGPVDFRVRMRGVSDDLNANPDHGVRLTARTSGGAVVATSYTEFEGRTIHETTFASGGGATPTPAMTLEMRVETGPWQVNDVILDFVEATYPRAFQAVGDRLEFEWPDGAAEFLVGGLSGPDVRVFELRPAGGVGPVLVPREIANVEVQPGTTARFRIDPDPAVPDGAPRRFLVAGPTADAVLDAADAETDTVSDLRDPAKQADYLVIAHPDLLDVSVGRPFDQWRQYRESAAGGGHAVEIAWVQDVYDEFGDGTPGADAIREFLRWVMSDAPGEGWADPRPSFVLFVGDASFDYKGGLAAGNYVPTQMMFYDVVQLGYYASDTVLVSVVGDDAMPDLLAGRIPARRQVDVEVAFDKFLDYETAAPGGAWETSFLFLSDRGKYLADGVTPNAAESMAFGEVNDLAIELFDGTPYGPRHYRYQFDYFDASPNPSAAANAMRADIKAAVNGTDGVADGVSVLQFLGHGNFQVWSDDAFWDERPPVALQDSQDLGNGLRLPVMMAHNCLTGGFHSCPSGDCATQTYNLAEQWLLRPSGGASATFSPTGLSFNFISENVSQAIWTSWFGEPKERTLATPLLEAYAGLCGTPGLVQACQFYSLLGDPALRMPFPHVDPPTALQAAAGNMSVDLDWVASASAGATYDVYRQQVAPTSTAYAHVGDSTGTSFLDTGLTNTATYRYKVVAVDPAGFESRPSNFNADCDVAGPDCVEATPLNPDPPAPPTGVTVEDPGIGTALRVSWAPNVETDLARYTLHLGPASGAYDTALPLSKGATSVVVQGLTEGVTYFMALTATNTSDKTSGFSAEVSDFPVRSLGLRPPAFIDDLRVRDEGDDLVLEWTEVDRDAYGKPQQPVLYEILRGEAPDWSNDGLTVFDTCAWPCTTWTHPGEAAVASSSHYRVRAVSADGLKGALGSALPRPTELRVLRSPTVPGNVLLEWDPVIATLAGGPADVARYEIYASDQPFSRLDVEEGALAPLAVVEGTSLDLTPGAGDRYYSVLAVDVRGNRSPF